MILCQKRKCADEGTESSKEKGGIIKIEVKWGRTRRHLT